MKPNRKFVLLSCAATFLLVSAAVAQGPAPVPPATPPAPAIPAAPPPPAPILSGTYANISGTVAQINYNRDALPEGFLLSDKTLVHFPPAIAVLIGQSFKPGDKVEIAGYANSNASGTKSVEAQQLRDHSSGKTFTIPQPGAAAPYTASGRIQQLNYGPDGAINGFLLDNGTFATMPPFSGSNPSSIRTGAAVSFTGYARTTITGQTVVDLQTVTINGQSMTLARSDLNAPLPPPPAPAPAVATGAGQRDQPPPPPAPPADTPQKQ